MKIAIESNDGQTIKSPFIPTKGYVVYHVKDSGIVETEYRESNSKDFKTTDQKNNTLVYIRSLLNDCSAIISRGMDRGSIDVLKQDGKEVFITFKTSAKDAVHLYMREQILNNKFAH